MASSASPFTPSHTSGTPCESGIKGWHGSSSLVHALGQTSVSHVAVPPEWHNLSDQVPDRASPSNPFPPSPASSDYLYASSSSSTAPSPARSTATPPPKKKTTSRRVAKSPGHIPRPRNAFMIFRSIYGAEVKASQIEHDHRIISKILGEVWRNLDPEKKARYTRLAAEEKREHERKYPGYRFAPRQRSEKPRKRNVRRNGPADKRRNKHLARLLLEGKGGDALKAEVEKFDLSAGVTAGKEVESADFSTGVFDSRTWVPPVGDESFSPGSSASPSSPPDSLASGDSPAFRSPLLPPSTPAAQTPAIRTPLEIPEMAQLESLPPLSPMQLSPFGLQTPTHVLAPALGPIPLPETDHSGAHYAAYYQQSPPALGLEGTQLQPQGELELNDLYIPRSASAMVNAEYAYQAAHFPHHLPPSADDVVSSAPFNTHLPPQLGAAPGYPLGYAQHSAELAGGAGSSPMDCDWSLGQWAAAQYASGEAQQYSAGLIFPPAQACSSQAGDAASLNGWSFRHGGAFDLPTQGEPQPATPWADF